MFVSEQLCRYGFFSFFSINPVDSTAEIFNYICNRNIRASITAYPTAKNIATDNKHKLITLELSIIISETRTAVITAVNNSH